MYFIQKTIRRLVAISCISGTLIVANLPLFNAFEAHVVNVTATACSFAEIRSKGYWKTHIEDANFQPYKSQNLGNSVVASSAEAITILRQDGNMLSKMKAQLLAMKFNIAYLNVGGFLDETGNKTLSEITEQADLMIINGATSSELEEMKDILEYWNTKGSLKYCGGIYIPPTPVLVDSLVINKVYLDPDSYHKNDCDANEWIEIMNPTSSDINLKDWQICDNISCDYISLVDVVLSSGEFAIISDSSSTWKFWDIPTDVIKISLGTKIGSGLDDDSDMLLLKNPEEGVVDQMNWGVANSSWNNSNSDLWTTGVTGFAQGDLLSRNPNGYDTDQVSDWTVFELPEVTVTYPNGGEVFYVGNSYELTWNAINPNGDDEDLSIDIWYSKDSGATWANIVKDTKNDGLFKWERLPLYLYTEDGGLYYTPSDKSRIKVVATDYTKNFMLTAWDMSDQDYCPPINFDNLTEDEIAMLAKLGITEDSSIEDIYAQAEIVDNMDSSEYPEKDSEDENTEEQENAPAMSSSSSYYPSDNTDEPSEEYQQEEGALDELSESENDSEDNTENGEENEKEALTEEEDTDISTVKEDDDTDNDEEEENDDTDSKGEDEDNDIIEKTDLSENQDNSDDNIEENYQNKEEESQQDIDENNEETKEENTEEENIEEQRQEEYSEESSSEENQFEESGEQVASDGENTQVEFSLT